jgi:hypothetical protein
MAMGYGDRTYCSSKVKVHTCGREFTDEDRKNAERWWGGKDFPVAYSNFCEEIEEVQTYDVTITRNE